jgi:hypothetical protein
MRPSEAIFQQLGGLDALKRSVDEAKGWLVRSVLEQIATSDPNARVPCDPPSVERIEEVLRATELRALDLLPRWYQDPSSGDGQLFKTLCSGLFELRRALPPADVAQTRVKEMVLLACQGVIGDRTSDVRRYLRENAWPDLVDGSDSWSRRVFADTADALLRVIRKDGWGDLEAVAEKIQALREAQSGLEGEYLLDKNGVRQAAALELVCYYHFAKSIEVLGLYAGTGEPPAAVDEIAFHLDKAISAADAAGIIELALLLRWCGAAARCMVRASLWHQLAAYNSKMTAFKKALCDPHRRTPLFELLPPQREAIQEVMNVGNRALVVQLPTSSGKTLLAEFRILQTKVNVPDAWIAYLVPTRALVNQVTMRLRRDLAPLGLKVEQASPALEVDVFEDELLQVADFDVLVTTPEKLDLLVRSGQSGLDGRTLGLVVADEAHNLGQGERGLRMELLLAMLNRESPDTHFLLLTPFVPNADELARWLDDERSRSISPQLSVDWQPNDRVVGLVYPDGAARQWGLSIKTLHTSKPAIQLEGTVDLTHPTAQDVPVSAVRQSKNKVAAVAAGAVAHRNASIVLAYSPRDTWRIARELALHTDELDQPSQRQQLVRGFVESEYGPSFELCELLDRGIGVHHSGISPEVRQLLEWLMEEGDLRTLVATTTLAQGVNFPVSSVVLATHRKPRPIGDQIVSAPMGPDEFWNIAGRAGRVLQDSLGLVLFASQRGDDSDLQTYAVQQVQALASALEQMVVEINDLGWELDLRRLVRSDAKWSSFVQFLSHTYRQIGDHGRFIADTEMLLRRTYAYRRLVAHKPDLAEQLVDSAKEYAGHLRNLPAGVASLVDLTGFSPETIADLLKKKDTYSLDVTEWSPSQLFRAGEEGLASLVGSMLGIKELRIDTPRSGDSDSIARLLGMWVDGRSFAEMASALIPEDEAEDESLRITECCRLLFQRLAGQTSWGLAALQCLAGIDTSGLTDEQREQFRSLPAMVFYGCSTVDGVLMRTLGVPRGLAVALGEQFRQAAGEMLHGTTLARARTWLEDAPTQIWENARRPGDQLYGKDYRNVWRVLNGHEPEF